MKKVKQMSKRQMERARVERMERFALNCRLEAYKRQYANDLAELRFRRQNAKPEPRSHRWGLAEVLVPERN